MIKPKGISFIISYQCDLKCSHCFFQSNIGNNVLDPETVKVCLEDIKDYVKLEWLHITGGEPFLFQQNLTEIIKIGKRYGITNIGTVSNAFWATSREIAVEILSKLKDAGLTGLCVSADYFHQLGVPLDRVKNVIYAMKYLNLNGHSYIVSCFIGSRKTKCRENKKEEIIQNKETEKIINEIKEICGPIPIAEVYVRPIGRGSTYGNWDNGIIEGYCDELCVCLGDIGPMKPQMVYIDCYKLVQICYGIIIGNVNKKSFKNVLTEYDSSQNIIIDTITQNGPIGLLSLAENFGYKRKNTYLNKCHLCYDTRKFLTPFYPNILSPRECYPN